MLFPFSTAFFSFSFASARSADADSRAASSSFGKLLLARLRRCEFCRESFLCLLHSLLRLCQRLLLRHFFLFSRRFLEHLEVIDRGLRRLEPQPWNFRALSRARLAAATSRSRVFTASLAPTTSASSALRVSASFFDAASSCFTSDSSPETRRSRSDAAFLGRAALGDGGVSAFCFVLHLRAECLNITT